ncbi:MAG: hypothetical protein DRG20_04285 [Deltaproteobacteria bacterium]|nr:MAG: hypothetical protein DRG20_04285 [Deltaproteobacteria bacterium]
MRFDKKNIKYQHGYLKIIFNRYKTNKRSTVTFTFKDIAQGWYAIALYHDINNNVKCNRKILGISVEPFGFPRNFKVKLSATSFNDRSFNLNDNDLFKY